MNEPLKKFLVSQLRRISWKWSAYAEAKKRQRVSYGHYLCQGCGNIYRAKETQLDHINPVVPISGWDGLEPYVERLFCEPDQLQVLCLGCHSKKTLEENQRRRK